MLPTAKTGLVLVTGVVLAAGALLSRPRPVAAQVREVVMSPSPGVVWIVLDRQ